MQRRYRGRRANPILCPGFSFLSFLSLSFLSQFLGFYGTKHYGHFQIMVFESFDTLLQQFNKFFSIIVIISNIDDKFYIERNTCRYTFGLTRMLRCAIYTVNYIFPLALRVWHIQIFAITQLLRRNIGKHCITDNKFGWTSLTPPIHAQTP